MTRPRLILVTRQFWPLVGGAHVMMGNLAEELQSRGCRVTVLTARWEPSWPAELVHRGVRVVRLPQPRGRFWGTWRYMQALEHWLKTHRDTYDLVYVSMLKHDAYAALGAVASDRVPVVVRPELGGPLGDVRWQDSANFGQIIRRRVRTATAWVANAPWIRDELVAAGYPAERIYEIANGVKIPPPRDESDKALVREEWAGVERRMAIPEGAPLAIYTGRLHASKGLNFLVAAWPTITARWPEARLWLVGDGPERDALMQQIRDLRLLDRVILTGRFDTVDDFHRAADLFVLPSFDELMSLALLEAMAAGMPIVASDIAGNRNLITSGREGLLVPPKDSASLAAAIARLIDDREQASRLGQAARRRVSESFTLAKVADEHLELFERLIRQRAESQ